LLSGASGRFRQSFASAAGIAGSGEVSHEICAAISADVGAPVLATDLVRQDRHESRCPAVVDVKPTEHPSQQVSDTVAP